MLLAYREKLSFFAVGQRLGVHHQTVQRCIERALAYGPLMALDDRPRPGKEPTITPEAKAWLVSQACRKAKELGYPHELWTTRLLARHAREHGAAAGHECLANLVQGTVCKILGQEEVKPHKVRYYLERRDAEFEQKMAEVLCVYREVQVLKKAAAKAKKKKPGKPVTIVYSRNGATNTVTMKPVFKDPDGTARWMIGVASDIKWNIQKTQLSFPAALRQSVIQNTKNASLIFEFLRGMVERRMSAKNLEGPIGIAHQATPQAASRVRAISSTFSAWRRIASKSCSPHPAIYGIDSPDVSRPSAPHTTTVAVSTITSATSRPYSL